ncbi:hypothetical protein F5Y17DRAFT_414995 [Xylariaceae sp. FL0594]|nr:hypothetical protein F5Y17DRAFT_414995 [Xylariaceae sp. FL0594]
MKVLVVGATGLIGGECLRQCLSHPDVTSVVAFVRRELDPSSYSGMEAQKLTCVLIDDFLTWSDDILREHADAVGMIWAMGTYAGHRGADLEYPLAFLQSMERVLLLLLPERKQRLTYVQLSGMFTRQDQEKRLLFLEYPRKLKGLLETKVEEFAETHKDTWRVFIVRPGGVAAKKFPGSYAVAALLGDSWCVRLEHLGAYMADLAARGGEEGREVRIENQHIAKRGRELLRGRAQSRAWLCD